MRFYTIARRDRFGMIKNQNQKTVSRILWIMVLMCLPAWVRAQDCSASNTTFKTGEEITYIISYDWFVVWTEVGEVKISITDTVYEGNPAYKYYALGETYKNWNWIFKVKDEFKTIVDQATLKPFFSSRVIREGKYRQWDKYMYDHEDSVAHARTKTNDHPMRRDTIPIDPCTFDIMSALLYARNIDFTKYEVGETFPVTILLDREAYPIYFRYLGIEDYKLRHVGTFECVKFSVLLIEGEMFHEGEDMTIWATNDKNHIVIYAESPILVGSVKARILNIKNNRYPLTSFEK